MHTHKFRLSATLLAAAIAVAACDPNPQTAAESTKPASPTTINELEKATRAGLGMTVTEYRERATTALAASSAAARFTDTTDNIEVLWIAADGTPTLGVSSQAAAAKARAAHWETQIVPPRAETDRRYTDAQRWLAEQPPRTKASIVLMWPDYTTGAVNAARNTTVDPSSAPQYPSRLRIRDVPGQIGAASAQSPIEPRPYRAPSPGDAFRTGKTPNTTCTIGVPNRTGFITVEHCTAPAAVAQTLNGSTPMGEAGPGPTERTRTIPAVVAQSIRVGAMSVPIAGLGVPVIGAPLCKAGVRSGWQCGTIVGLDGSDTFISTACSLSGDSGGPAVIGSTAVGVTDVSTIGNQAWCPDHRSTTLVYTVHRTVV